MAVGYLTGTGKQVITAYAELAATVQPAGEGKRGVALRGIRRGSGLRDGR